MIKLKEKKIEKISYITPEQLIQTETYTWHDNVVVKINELIDAFNSLSKTRKKHETKR